MGKLDSVESFVDVGSIDMGVCYVSYILFDLICRRIALVGVSYLTFYSICLIRMSRPHRLV